MPHFAGRGHGVKHTPALVIAGYVVAALLSTILAWFVGARVPLLSAGYAVAAVSCVVAAALVIRGADFPETWQVSPLHGRLLIAGTFTAFFLMGLGCMGDPFDGCGPLCTVIKLGVTPLGTFALWRSRERAYFSTLAVAVFALVLVPNCVCVNPPNAVFLKVLGWPLSPACYLGPFIAALFAVSALYGRHVRLFSAGVATLTAVMAVFAIGHQTFHWPW